MALSSGTEATAPDDLAALYDGIASYYTGKIQEHGPTPRGVDWSCPLTQELRFIQLLRLCDFSRPFSLNDVGCGYGALVGFMGRRHRGAKVDYLGVDVSAAMIAQAKSQWARRKNVSFAVACDAPRQADYTVASGIFNVRLNEAPDKWLAFIRHCLRAFARNSRLGFSVNFLAPLPPHVIGKPELYRTAPEPWVEFCETTLGLPVTVLASYGMQEFTLLVGPARAP